MNPCLICLNDVETEGEYHARCLSSLFGTTVLPVFDFRLEELYQIAAEMAGKMSISGVQEKVSLALSADAKRLEATNTGGRFILKPETTRYSSIPCNEHLTMVLARLVSIEMPAFGLIRLKDGTFAFIIKRFDRLDDGTKIQVEDFCQLDKRKPKDKYKGSGELCVRILNKYATEPLIDIRRLFQLFLFSWWVSNGDLHLKNLSLITTRDGIIRLSPAYDLVCTRLIIRDDEMALSIGGRRSKLNRQYWMQFAEYCGIPQRAAERLVTQQIDVLEESLNIVAASFLPKGQKEEYEKILVQNTHLLNARVRN